MDANAVFQATNEAIRLLVGVISDQLDARRLAADLDGQIQSLDHDAEVDPKALSLTTILLETARIAAQASADHPVERRNKF